MTGWVDGPMLGYDCESTGVSVESDHILSASLVHVEPIIVARVGSASPPIIERYTVRATTEWINPGVPIPAGATAIHGITDEYIQLNGGDPAEMLDAIVSVLEMVLVTGTPLVGMNVPYDLTILDRNCRRHGVTPLGERLEIAPVIDIMVLDKAVDPYRRGSGMRKLGAICPLYRVDPGTAHDSESDALAACRIAWRIGRMYPRLGALSAQDLHTLQIGWKLDQDTSFAAYLVRQGKDPSGVDGQWPVRMPPERPITAHLGGTVETKDGKLVSLW